MAGGAEIPNIAALPPPSCQLGASGSARRPDADRHVELLVQFAARDHSWASIHIRAFLSSMGAIAATRSTSITSREGEPPMATGIFHALQRSLHDLQNDNEVGRYTTYNRAIRGPFSQMPTVLEVSAKRAVFRAFRDHQRSGSLRTRAIMSNIDHLALDNH